jgi:hypothetical protein
VRKHGAAARTKNATIRAAREETQETWKAEKGRLSEQRERSSIEGRCESPSAGPCKIRRKLAALLAQTDEHNSRKTHSV